MRDEFGDEPAKSKTRAELQDDLRKYGITPRPGYDPKGPNLPDNVPDPSTTREKYRDKAAEADAKKESKQGSLFGDDAQTDPNKAEMDRRAAKAQEDKAAAREAKKAAKAEKGDAPKQASMISPKGNTTAAGRGGSGSGGSGGMGMPKLNRDISKPMKKGGKVSSASSRADGIATKGKTRGKMC
jgi:hypothetical protein